MDLPRPQDMIRIILTMKDWHVVVLDRLGLNRRNDPIGSAKLDIVRFRDGLAFETRPNTTDSMMLAKIVSNRRFNPPGFELRKGDIVFDVGAHIGSFTVWAAKQIGDGKVYAFEPDSRNRELASRNVLRNKVDNAKVYGDAISGENQQLEIWRHPTDPAAHSAYGSASVDEHDAGSPMRAQAFTIEHLMDKLGIRRLSFLKMNCEGLEFDIITTMRPETLARIDKMAMQFHEKLTGRKAEEITDHLERNGFVVSRQWNNKREGRGIIYAKRR